MVCARVPFITNVPVVDPKFPLFTTFPATFNTKVDKLKVPEVTVKFPAKVATPVNTPVADCVEIQFQTILP
jgi:hypothetical protein